MKTLLLKAPGFLGDEVVFTGVVRELKKETGWNLRIQTNRPDLWKHHPSIAGVGATGVEDQVLEKDHCPPYYASNQIPLHFLERYLSDFRAVLGLRDIYRIHKFAGEVPVSAEEMIAPPFDLPSRYWVMVAGWKPGVPAKAWPMANYQQVVDEFKGRIHFVQTGARQQWHPPLRGVRNVVGATDMRQLISLIYHAEGVVCPITSIMHLAAAIPPSCRSRLGLRPCVVIAGGREAPHYIAYPMHRVLSMVGQLHCCASGGCGKSNFGPGQCPHPTDFLKDRVPKCMTLIKPIDVVQAIEFFYRGELQLPPRMGVVEALSQRINAGGGVGRSNLNGVVIGAEISEIAEQLLRAFEGLRLTMIDSRAAHLAPARLAPHGKNVSRQSLGSKPELALSSEFAASRYKTVSSVVKGLATTGDQSVDFVLFNMMQGIGTRQDLVSWYSKVKPGGVVCGSPYQSVRPGHKGAKEILDGVASQLGLAVGRDKANSWFIRKIEQK